MQALFDWRARMDERGDGQSTPLALANARGLSAEGWAFSRSEKADPSPP